jgi:Icc-related predicted phosphoesterase
MIRRLNLPWPDDQLRAARNGRPVRLLAVSDEQERSLEFESNRAAIRPLDAIVGCGDLEPDYLGFLADAFCVPLLYVRGNHDRGANWSVSRHRLPRPLDARPETVGGITLAGMSWPGQMGDRAPRDDGAAWRQALGLLARRRLRGPVVMVSHVPPLGLGDTPEDVYHRGFAAYHWLCRRVQPVLWLHGHTSMAAAKHWRTSWAGTTLVNATGAVLVEVGATD